MIYYLSLKPETPNRNYWDMGILNLLEADYDSYEVDELPKVERAIVVIPARHHAGLENEINEQLAKIDKVVLFLMGDEEASFDVDALSHPNIHIWVQNPHPDKHEAYNRIGTGYPPQSQELLKTTLPEKDIDLFFAGQVTHDRRKELKGILDSMNSRGYAVEKHYSAGFTQGLKPKTYYDLLSRTKVAPAPSGAVIPDSFRLFEALESMTIPIGDNKCPDGEIWSYWDFVFSDIVPFPCVTDWNSLPDLYNEIMSDYPHNLHKITSWWLMWKYKFKHKVREQLGLPPKSVTAVIPTSIIPSHPSTDIIDQTIKSIRAHLPDIDIIITVDGLRDEQQDQAERYNKYKTNLLWHSLHTWDRVYTIINDDFGHQSTMMQRCIDDIHSPVILYMEHDTPLVSDEPIDWNLCIEKILRGDAYTIRFHHEGVIPHEHEPLMIGKDGKFVKTYQWSQRPHLSSKVYYRDLVLREMPPQTFIEDILHGVVQADWHKDGHLGWYRHRLWIYAPNTKNIKRSYHLDGRAGTRKFTSDDEQWGLK